MFSKYLQSESPSTSELNALAAYLLYSLVFVVAMMVEFAIIILISRRKSATSEENTSKKENENALSLRLDKMKIAPFGDVNEPENRNCDSVEEKENQNRGMSRIKKFISGISVPHAIDFVAFWSFIFVFVWFNFDQLLPLLN